MLKIKYHHFFGSQARYDLQLLTATLDPDGLDEREALENGWLFCKEWYQTRSVRIRVADFKANTKMPLSCKWSMTRDMDVIRKIYSEYKEVKGFEEDFDVFTNMDRAKWLLVEDEGVPVAFTKFNMYDGGIESQFTSWNYHRPKYSLGLAIVTVEVDIARLMGYDHLYIGQGYESSSTYKSRFKGFEWWNGHGWSTDREEYVRLCNRDSSINTIKELAEAFHG
jgi:hypothetical protein